RDLLDALKADGASVATLLVDGGFTSNAWAMQFLADICDCPIERPAFQEVTALGAAKLAAKGAGLKTVERKDAGAKHWTPTMQSNERERLLGGWRRAVAGTLAVAETRVSPAGFEPATP